MGYLEQDARPDALTGAVDAPLFTPTKNPRYGGRTDKVMTADAIWRMVKRYALAAGRRCGGCRRWQAMAGHSDPKTTVRYDSRRGDLDDSTVYRVDYSS